MPSEADITTVGAFRDLTDGVFVQAAAQTRPPAPAILVPLCLIVLDALLGLSTVIGRAGAAGLYQAEAARAWAGPALLFLALAMGFMAWHGLYRTGLATGQCAAAARALTAALAVSLLALLLLGPEREFGPSQGLGWMAGTLVLAMLAMLAGRCLAVLALLGPLHTRLAPRAVVVGAGANAAALLAAARRDRAGPRIVGLIDDRRASDQLAVPYLGDMARLEELARAGLVEQVILALPWSAEQRMADLIGRCAALPVEIRIVPQPLARHWPAAAATRLGDLNLVHVLDRPVAGWAGLVKRGEDLLLGALLLAAFALPMALLALAIRLDSPGPALFRQRRIGFENHAFAMFKFRTMRHASDPDGVCVQATWGDPRVTRLGAFLRRTSLDELPQLFNVLRGEMSLVGPRPHAPGTLAGGRLFEEVVAFYAGRHRVKPGITGLAQVRGLRGETRTEAALHARVAADFEYIQNWSLWLDLRILLRTAVCVLTMRNAY